MLYLRRSFTLTDGEVALTDDREEVEQKVQWKPKAATAADDTAPVPIAETRSAEPGCRCHESATQPLANDGRAATPTTAAGENKETTMAVTEKAKALATKLIACSVAPYQESDRATLEAWPESALENLDKAYEGAAVARAAAESPTHPTTPSTPSNPPSTPSTPTTPTTPPAPTNPAPKALAEWLADAPPEVKALVSRAQAADAQTKAFYVEQITKLQAAGAYSAEQLNAMTTDQLEPLARALNAPRKVDFSPLGAPVSPQSVAAGAKYPDPPSPWDKPVKAAADQTVQ
jgi:hypothetical protein